MHYHGRNLRKGRFSAPGHVYHITTATQHRRPFFSDLSAARTLIQSLKQEDAIATTQTLAFVVMPDHLHWLFTLQAGDLSQMVKRVKSVTSKRIGFSVWQSGFYDHAIRAEEDLLATARYIVANPLRANIVEHIGDYPHWDCVWL
ncbi:transposase [Salinispirillum sp. LH 10-3-1]|uniref:Transposase n=1 Tax=Salinispirillum sp. LH 10-3-1 TaxID=2952525 RepID=A0AB38YIW7_9GAMM